MKLSCSSPMVPGETLTEKAMALRAWGYDGISVFWPLGQWNETVREELVQLERRTGVTPCEFVLTDSLYGRLMDPDAASRTACRRRSESRSPTCSPGSMAASAYWRRCAIAT